MIKSVDQVMGAIETARLRESGPARVAAPVVQETAARVIGEPVATPASRMAAQGAPVDMERITKIKQAIASGNYPVDPDKIAEKMLDLDLPSTNL